MARRLAGILLVAAVVAAFEYWRYCDVDWFTRDHNDNPMKVGAARAYRVATVALFRFGGLPPDARLVHVYPMTALGRPYTGHAKTISYTFEWQPNGTIATGEYIDVAVEGDPPAVAWIRRTWQPWWLRAYQQHRIVSSAKPIPMPDRVETSCPSHRFELGALRRVLGSMIVVRGETLERWEPAPNVASLLREPGTTVAFWRNLSVPVPWANMRIGVVRTIVRDAWYQRRRHVDVEISWTSVGAARIATDSWIYFDSSDGESICSDALPTPVPAGSNSFSRKSVRAALRPPRF